MEKPGLMVMGVPPTFLDLGILKELRAHFSELRILKDLQDFLLQLGATCKGDGRRRKRKSSSKAAALYNLPAEYYSIDLPDVKCDSGWLVG